MVKGRLDDMAMVTRADHIASEGMRGSGNLVKHLAVFVFELVVKLVLELGYPIGRLVRMMKGLGRRWNVWSEMVMVLQRFRDLWTDHEEKNRSVMEVTWTDGW